MTAELGMKKFGHVLVTQEWKMGRVTTEPLKSCAPGGIRTPNPQLRRLMLYPVELLALMQ
jgi:hypothetical protein